MRIAALFAVLLIVLLPAAPAAAQGTDTIVAIVGDTAIARSQVTARARLMAASGGRPLNATTKEAALTGLIDEALQMAEAARIGETPPEAEVKAAFVGVAQQNGMSAAQFRTAMSRAGVDPGTLEDRLAAQIAWADVVKAEVLPTISVPQAEVDAAVARAVAEGLEVNPEKVGQALLNQRVGAAAQARLRALRSSTFIERRDAP